MDRRALRTLLSICISAAWLAGCVSEVINEPTDVGADVEPLSATRELLFSAFDDPAGIGQVGSREARRLITSAAQYARVFGHAAPSEVDFAAGEIVVFYNAGVKRTGGYSASVQRIELRAGTLSVTTRLQSPGANCIVTYSLTHPYALAKLQRPRGMVRAQFERDDHVRDCSSGPFCGGIAGIACPGNGQCGDDPSDNCDPNNGGADCGGVCTCIQNALCVRGAHFDSAPSVCACVPDPTQDPCAAVRCKAGTHCEAQGDQASCVSDAPFCGGIAGIRCPGAGACADNPNDACDPDHGGADCGGLCQCLSQGMCASGLVWDDSPSVCACVPTQNPCAATLCQAGTRCEVHDGSAVCVSNGALACGPNTCAAGTTCCNASCGICTPPGQFCIQLACNVTP
jgi:hypothetical protein